MQVGVIYHDEDGSWWAESPDVPGFSAAAESLAELRVLTREHLAWHFGFEPEILEDMADCGLVTTVSYAGPLASAEVHTAAAGSSHVSSTVTPPHFPVFRPSLSP